jgi:mannose-6-phosphate isomerase-like protein (cupin superfamily)
MNNPEFPYVNHMNILHKPLEQIDVPSLVRACTDKWYNQTLCQVNEAVIRLGILQGEYHRHKHDTQDEFFFTLEGELFVDIEDRPSMSLKPQQGCVVPKGVLHRTRAPQKTIVLMVENVGIIPTGDA